MNAAREFFEAYFTPFQLANTDGTLDGLVTGYYEPLLRGSRTRHGPYQYALYRWPYRFKAGSALPARAQLESSGVLNGNELVWVDDPIEAFFPADPRLGTSRDGRRHHQCALVSADQQSAVQIDRA